MYTKILHSVIKTSCILGALVVFGAQSCTSLTPKHQWIGKALVAESDQNKGDLDLAENEFKELLKDAPDGERKRWVQFQLAEILLKKGKVSEATVGFLKIHDDNIEDIYGAKSLFRVSELKKQPELLWVLIQTYPNTYSAEKALKRLRDSESDLNRLVIRAQKAIDERPDSTLVDNLLLFQARIFSRLSLPNQALEKYRTLYAHDSRSSLADDALWEIAQIYKASQQWKDAISTYKIFESRIESSFFVGSYTPHLADDAIFDAGKIALLLLNDFEQAERFFTLYLDSFPDHIEADDALWLLSETYRLAQNPQKRQDAIARLKNDYPDSRFVKRTNVASYD